MFLKRSVKKLLFASLTSSCVSKFFWLPKPLGGTFYLEGMGSSTNIIGDRLRMRGASNPDRFVGAVFTRIVSTPQLQGLGRIHNSIVQSWSSTGVVKRTVLVGENPTNAMMAVTCGRRAGSAKGPELRTTKKYMK